MTLTRRPPGQPAARGNLLVASAQTSAPLVFGVGLFQPDREKNDATYRPLAEHLAARLGRPVQLRTVDTWEGLAKSLASGETDIVPDGPWGYVLANHEAGCGRRWPPSHEGKPEYHAPIVTHPARGLSSAGTPTGPKRAGPVLRLWRRA